MKNNRPNRYDFSTSKGSGYNQPMNTAMTAVAFQDHLLRQIGSLSLANPTGQGGPKKPSLASRLRPVKKEAKAVVDTRRGKTQQKIKPEKKSNEKEFVLDAKPPVPTLAQKMGLVDAPDQLLTEDEWKDVKEASDKRDYFIEPCVICKEELGTSQQVLLSCSHVFHRNCLQAFERFTGKKSCPMCRKEQYQTRVVHDGSKHYKQKCATKIQATWKGYVVRTWYKKLRETMPPKDPALRKKFYEDKLHSITERMVQSMDYDIDSFFNELDRNVEAGREVLKHFDTALKVISEEDWLQIQLKAVERCETECPICLTSLEDPGLVDISENNSLKEIEPKSLSKTSKSNKTNEKSTGVKNKNPALKKGKSPAVKEKGNGSSQCKSVSHPRRRVLLSCSHVFHETCLQAFEDLAVGEHQRKCPCCRSSYQKKVL